MAIMALPTVSSAAGIHCKRSATSSTSLSTAIESFKYLWDLVSSLNTFNHQLAAPAANCCVYGSLSQLLAPLEVEYYFPRCAVTAALALAPVLFLLFLLPGER